MPSMQLAFGIWLGSWRLRSPGTSVGGSGRWKMISKIRRFLFEGDGTTLLEHWGIVITVSIVIPLMLIFVLFQAFYSLNSKISVYSFSPPLYKTGSESGYSAFGLKIFCLPVPVFLLHFAIIIPS